MPARKHRLWPYGTVAGLVAMPAIWLAFVLLMFYARALVNWSDPMVGRLVVPLALAAGLVPLLLLLVDYLAASRGMVDIKGIKIDFGRAEVGPRSITLPDNIGRPEPIITDSSPMEIVATLQAATANRIVRLDIKDGSAWWVTRLVALTVGAVRAGSPKILVFVGLKEGIDEAFLGWSEPSDLLRALRLDDTRRGPLEVTYAEVLRRAVRIAKQIEIAGTLGEPPPPPMQPPPVPLPPPPGPDVQRYLQDPQYAKLGEEVLEQILMDQLAAYDLERPPDRLTLARLEELFAPWLHRDFVDLDWPQDKQARAFLESPSPYIALVRRQRYEGLAEQSEITRLVLLQLLTESGV